VFYLWLWKTYRTAQSCGSERRILRLFYYSAFSSERCDHVLISPGETGGDYRGSGGIVGDGNVLGMIWCFGDTLLNSRTVTPIGYGVPRFLGPFQLRLFADSSGEGGALAGES